MGNIAYNPIVNPIPNYMQNPYIMRQKQQAISQRKDSRGANEGVSAVNDLDINQAQYKNEIKQY